MKYEYQSMPTVRKRTIKIIHTSRAYELHYMSSYRTYYTEEDLLAALPEALGIIRGWGEELTRQKATK